jgi:hypothetical protein
MRHLNRVHLSCMSPNASWRLCVCSAYILSAVSKLATLLRRHHLMSDVLSGRLTAQINRVVTLLACSRVLLVRCYHLCVISCTHLPYLLGPIILVEI